ncbi:MAG: hypothetical protein OEZ43_16550 [Gammaproteobacteria bacterium]|nr:hypothetical protein [Gammaproteobacteria bacterium]
MGILTDLPEAGKILARLKFIRRNAGKSGSGEGRASSVKEDAIPETVIQEDNKKFGREAKIVTTIFAVLVAVLLVTWYSWRDEYLMNAEDLIYNMGLIGGIMMLLQFVYSMRKRVDKMRRWGNLRFWFLFHTFIGLSAPTIIVIHSRFSIESVNGGVAFFSMLLVVISGIVGRYLYSQVNFDLKTARQELKELHQTVHAGVLQHHPDQLREIENMLKLFMLHAFANSHGVIHAFSRAFGVSIRSRQLYWALIQMRQMSAPGRNDGATMAMDGTPVFDREERRLLRIYLKSLTKLARYNAFKHLFSLWRIGHVPVIYLLLITGLAHVLAVHMY